MNSTAPLPQIIGNSPAMQEVFQVVHQVAPTNATVLIVGETGTGKEMIAKSVHKLSKRADGPYVRVNCGALSESLLESELFGHVKGAFTGAVENKTGRFEAAHTGTIFLDEISSMSSKLQVKLLRVLQEQEFERVGDSKTVQVDTRLVAATNQYLEDEVRAGRFREDLYYRLNVVPVYLPPVRLRRGDIPLLAEHFFRKYTKETGKRLRGFRPAVMERLTEYSWHGNVRELENYVERGVVLATGDWIELDLLPPAVRGEPLPRVIRQSAGDLPSLVEQLVRQAIETAGPDSEDLHSRVVGAVERELIRQVMTTCDQVQIKAAARLGINRNTLYKKLQEAHSNGTEDPGEARGL